LSREAGGRRINPRAAETSLLLRKPVADAPHAGGKVFGTDSREYHVLLEWFPSLESSNVCSAAVPCNFVWFEVLGFVTLPYMALSAFALILVLLTLPPAAVREDDGDLASQEAVA
jgi:hypothetical protein